MKSKLLLFTLLALLCAIGARADYPAESYQLKGTCLVKWLGNEQEIDFTSDAKLRQVTEIAPNAFAYKGNIQRIVLPASLRKIGFNAIYECAGLTEIVFAEGLEEIASEAFYRCPQLQTLRLPASVKSIGEAFVVNCKGITSYQLAGTNGYYKVVDGVLYNAAGTTLIAYPSAASGKSFTIPESVTRVGDYAFAYSQNLKSIKFSKKLTEMGRKAFFESKALAGSITIPGTIRVVADSAFYLCNYITEVTFEEGIEVIGKYAISHCASIEKVSMPSTITELGESCFSFMNSLLEFRNHMTTPIQGRMIFTDTKKYNATLYVPAKSVEAYKAQTTTWNNFKNTLPLEDNSQINPTSYKLEDEGRTLVSWSGPETDIDMSQDKVLNRVRTIKAFAFLNKDVKRVVLPEALETIEEGAFQNCEDLAEVVTNKLLRSIGSRAFWNNFALKSFTFPQSIEKVASDAFGYCTGLSKFVMASANEYYQVVDNVLLSADGTRLVCYAALRGESYTLPTSVTKIEKDAAAGAVGLVTLTLPEGLKEIGESAFQGASKLKKVLLPASLETFGPGAFMRCKSLEEYSVATGNTHYAVQGKILYSADLKTLVAYPEALSPLAIPAQVTAIAARAFQRNESLTEVILPANLKELGDYAFYHCANLRKVVALMSEPVSADYTGESPFGEINLKLATLVVPVGSANNYKKAAMWSDFGTIMEGDTPVTEGVITMTTTIPAGEKIFIVALNVDNNASKIEGVRIEGKDMIVEQPTITIRGDIATLMATQCHLTKIDVTGAPHLTTLYLPENQLTKLDLSKSALLESVILAHNKLNTIEWTKMPNLTALFLYDNELTSVDVTGMPKLTSLHIYNNQIGANAMEQIVNALPQRNPEDKADFMAIDTKNAKEGNRFEDRFLSVTTSKNWTVYDYAGGANEGKGVVYTSIEPQPLTGALRLIVEGAMLQITGAADGQIVRLYDLAGGLLYSGLCRAEGSCTLSLSDYPAGGYIVIVGDHAERIYIAR